MPEGGNVVPAGKKQGIRLRSGSDYDLAVNSRMLCRLSYQGKTARVAPPRLLATSDCSLRANRCGQA